MGEGHSLLRGDFRLGDAGDHANFDGIASFLTFRRPVKVVVKSDGLKCNEQILVRLLIWKSADTSLLILVIHA